MLFSASKTLKTQSVLTILLVLYIASRIVAVLILQFELWIRIE